MFRYVALIAVLLCSMACLIPGVASAEDEVLAEFGDRKITISYFNKTLGYLDSQKQQMIKQNPQLKEQWLHQLVQSLVIADLAKKAGYEKKADIIEKLDFFNNSFFATEYLKREIVDKITISEAETKSYYDDHKDEFKTPETVHVKHILIKADAGDSEEDRQKAKEKAEDILKKIRAGEDFEKLASEFSDDTTTKPKGGDIGFVTRGRLVRSFEDAAFSLKTGEVSDVVETQFGYHIIKAEEKKEAGIESYDALKERIKQNLLQERIQSEISTFIEKASKDAGVKFYTDLLTGEEKEE